MHESLTQSGVGACRFGRLTVSGDMDMAGPSTLGAGGPVASQPNGAPAVLYSTSGGLK